MKRPAFQFYPGDWLSDPNVMLMNPAEEGAYIRLVAICWLNGGLTTVEADLATLSRLGEKWFEGSGAKILQCFHEVGGKLQHKRLEQEREKQDEWKQKSREGGLRSAKLRLKGGSTKGQVLVQPSAKQPVEPTVNSSTPSSSSSSNNPLTPQGAEEEVKNIFQIKQEAEQKLIAWFKKMNDVSNAVALAKKYMSIYPAEIIVRVLKDSNCINRAKFVEIADHKLKSSKNNS